MKTVTLSRSASGVPIPRAADRARRGVDDGDRRLSWAACAGVSLLAAFLRLWQLDYPKSFEFDETYYAKDAWSLIHNGYVRTYVENANERILVGHLRGLWAIGLRWSCIQKWGSGSSASPSGPSG